jgi:peptidoglycan/LPS O-acetylase OafA/YrhL
MYPKLESLRGVAAVIVVLYHSSFYVGEPDESPLRHGYLFVDFFFILSGWVMSHAYEAKIVSGMRFANYAILRLGRLYPLHLVILLMWVPYIAAKQWAYEQGVGGTDPSTSANAWSFLSNLFLVNAMGLHDRATWNGPSWSIGAEWWTYLLYFASLRTFDRRRGVIVPVAVACAAGLALYQLTAGRSLDVGYDFGLVRCVAGFFAGVALYRATAQSGGVHAGSVAWAEGLVVLGVVAVLATAQRIPAAVYMAPLAFVPAVRVFASRESGPIGHALGHRVLRRIGMYSYSIYMVHALFSALFSNIAVYLLHAPVSGPDAEVRAL